MTDRLLIPVGEIASTAEEGVIRLRLVESRGRPALDIRAFTPLTKTAAALMASGRGVEVDVFQLRRLRELIDAAEDLAVERGLLERPDDD